MKRAVLIGMIIIATILLGLGLRILFFPVHVANRVIDTAEGVVDKTLNARNAVFNYEWFHDLYQGANQQLANISQVDKQIADLRDEYGGKPRAEWDRYGKERLSFLEDTRNGYIMAYNRWWRTTMQPRANSTGFCSRTVISRIGWNRFNRYADW